ncbi:VanZ family protein [Clostridium sp. A1-XYC3]|uniref:VanZ family protein n=1 Tax=Clostridium tanneri TaxID=3037988 RepID=A0ABU4JVM4_9CLOT|nr:VanZ family protein [Clostridium sp. A1-XYC3]MDW8802198.1 VanZ family protein [Clostridium sp. A1-XYC3]
MDNRLKFKKAIAIVLCLIWMWVIFYNSSNTGKVSNDRSYAVESYLKKQYNRAKELLNAFDKEKTINSVNDSQHKNQDKKVSSDYKQKTSIVNNGIKQQANKKDINVLIRKNAHAFEYLILSLLIGNLLFIFDFKGRKAIIYILFICLFYSVTDEFHQLFVPGRTSSVVDVLIDFLGAVIGTTLFYLGYYFLNKHLNKLYNPLKEKSS